MTPSLAGLVTAADDPALVALFEADRPVHPYALADLDLHARQATWWMRGSAAAGRLDLSESGPTIVYAVSAADPVGTLDLLCELAEGSLPDRFVATGPVGMTERLTQRTGRGGCQAVWSFGYDKFWLPEPERMLPPAEAPNVLGNEDVAALEGLYAQCMGPSSYFVPQLVTEGRYMGYYRDGVLAAAAGTHVLSRRMGVAAIGNVATHPEWRRRGLAAQLVQGLVVSLRSQVRTFGLNVRSDNPGARRLYENLGFTHVITYEEAEFHRA